MVDQAGAYRLGESHCKQGFSLSIGRIMGGIIDSNLQIYLTEVKGYSSIIQLWTSSKIH